MANGALPLLPRPYRRLRRRLLCSLLLGASLLWQQLLTRSERVLGFASWLSPYAKTKPRYETPSTYNPDKARNPTTMPEENRLTRLESIVEMIEEGQQVASEPRPPGTRRKVKEHMVKLHLMNARPIDKVDALKQRIGLWLPEVLSDFGLWQAPLRPDHMGLLLEAFSFNRTLLDTATHGWLESNLHMRTFQADVSRMLDRALRSNLGQLKFESVTALLEGLASSGIRRGQPWAAVAETLLKRCETASKGQLAQAAWSLATAVETAPREGLDGLTEGLLTMKPRLPPEQLRQLAAGLADVGVSLPQVFGPPPHHAGEEAMASGVCDALFRLASGEGNEGAVVTTLPRVLCADPALVLEVQGAITPEHAEDLVQLAEGLWRPSARQAGGLPLPGRPWSALLDSPRHLIHPAVASLRLWLADSLGVPRSHVEAPRIVRYRAGDQPGAPHLDTRPEGDSSLWLHGQRVAAALVPLRQLPPDADGETLFPRLLGGLAVAPAVGSAVLWHTVDKTGRPIEDLVRSVVPVAGNATKYMATLWVRSYPALDS